MKVRSRLFGWWGEGQRRIEETMKVETLAKRQPCILRGTVNSFSLHITLQVGLKPFIGSMFMSSCVENEIHRICRPFFFILYLISTKCEDYFLPKKKKNDTFLLFSCRLREAWIFWVFFAWPLIGNDTSLLSFSNKKGYYNNITLGFDENLWLKWNFLFFGKLP